MSESAPETAWMHGDPTSGYHDQTCGCPRHCGYCFEDLDAVREIRAELIGQGRMSPEYQLGARARYCSGWCRKLAKAERELDRRLAS
jgi:hypothetical protein